MNTHNSLVLSGVLAALVTSSQATAATASHQCSQLWDDALRLACYDTAFGKPHPPAESVASEAAAAPAAAVAAPAIVAAAPQAAPAAPAGKKKAKTSEPVQSTVAALAKTLDGRFRVTLENGQVWQQLELYPPVEVKVGEQVTLRHAALGSTQLVTSVGLAARVTQVK